MRRIVAEEGPLSEARLLLLTANCFGLTRLREYRVRHLAAVIPPDLRRDPEERFVWPDERHPLHWNGFRTWEGVLKERPLEEIPLRELANALVAIARSAMGIDLDELLKQTLTVFNGTRLTEVPRRRLMAALKVAEDRGQLHVSGDIVTATDG